MNDIKNYKLAWAVEAANTPYLIGCLRLAQRMRYLKSQFPVVVMISKNIDDSELQMFYDEGIEVVRFSNDEFMYLSNNTSSSFEALKLLDYDFIFNLEADMLPLVNIDKYFIDGFTHLFNKPYNVFTSGGITGYMFFKPSIAAYMSLFYDIKKLQKVDIVENTLIECNKNYLNLNCLKYINCECNLFTFPPETELAHFPGILKPWNQALEISRDFIKKFCTLSYTDFNSFVDETKDRWAIFSKIALLYREFCFNYNNREYYNRISKRAELVQQLADECYNRRLYDIKK